MKTRPFRTEFAHSSKSIPAIATLSLTAFLFIPLHAADVTWDIAPGTVGVGDSAITGGDGTWNTTAAVTPNGNWTIDAGVNNIAWDNASNDTALFGGTAGTVTLGANITAAGMEFSIGGYTVDGGGNTITLGNNGGIRNTSTPGPSLWTNAGTTTINANIDTNGFRFTTVGGGAAILNGVISGSGGFSTYNNSNVTLAGANTYTGKTFITSDTTGGSTLSVSSINSVDIDDLDPLLPLASSSLGAPTTVADGTIQLGNGTKQASCTFIYTGAGETTDRVFNVHFNGSAKHTVRSNATGGGLLKFTSTCPINRSSGNASAGFYLRGSGDGELAGGTSGGTIPGFLEKADAGTWTLGGTTTADKLVVSGGTLVVSGTFNSTTPGTGTVTASNGTLTVNGTLNFTSATISGGTVNGAGSLGIDIDGTSSDLITMSSGTLTATGLTIVVNATGAGLTESEYVLVNVTGGSLDGTFAGVTGASGYVLNYDTPGQVKLVQAGGSTYATWSGGAAADDDANGDGVQNAVAYALGAADPSVDARGLLPIFVYDDSTSPTYLVFTFNRDDDAQADGTTTISVEYGSNLSGWTTATHDPEGTGVIITETGSAPTNVEVKIPGSLAAGERLFARLNVVVTP